MSRPRNGGWQRREEKHSLETGRTGDPFFDSLRERGLCERCGEEHQSSITREQPSGDLLPFQSEGLRHRSIQPARQQSAREPRLLDRL